MSKNFRSLGIELCRVLLSLSFILSLGACAGGHVSDAPAPKLAGVRVTRPLMVNWQFAFNDSWNYADASSPNSRGWSPVTLPHTWNASDAATTNATVPYKRGRGWYRLEFTSAKPVARSWIEFEAASIVSHVWLNGRLLGSHSGAFGAFRFDVTADLRNGKNLLVVETDNGDTTQTRDWVAPTSGDFNMAGGLYRGVSLISTSAATHFSMDDSGSSGVYITTRSIAAGQASIEIRAGIRNDSSEAGSYTVQYAVVDAQGQRVTNRSTPIHLAGNESLESHADLVVHDAHLWQGVTDPYLYSVVAEISDSSGTVIDRITQKFGIREFRFDPDKGLFLNGQLTRLHGVNLHQDALGKAWAISDADVDESLAMIREMGANAVRLAHYEHSQHTYDQADKLGLIVWAENGFVGGYNAHPTCDPTAPDASAYFISNLEQQTRELIRQNYNHASIALWSVGNEVAQIQLRGCAAGQPAGRDNVTPVLRTLNTFAKSEDPTRVTALANITEGIPGSRYIADGGITDIRGINRYSQWYPSYGDTSTLSANLDLMHAKYPNQPLGITEYGAGAALGDQTDNPLGGHVEATNPGLPRVYQPEGYADFVHESVYPVIASKNYLWGAFVWTMFDFGSGIRNEGDLKGVNTKGLVSFDRKVRKDSFFYYKANWSTDPVVYIAGRRNNQRAYALADVTVYSNAKTTELSVNGRVIAALKSSDCAFSVCHFRNVRLSEGNNRLLASGEFDGKGMSDTVDWTLGEDNARNIHVAAGQLLTGIVSSSGHRFGSDNFFKGGRPVDGMSVPTPGSSDAQLYAHARAGAFSYDLPLADGQYDVTLGFVASAGKTSGKVNVFDVSANGIRKLSGFDVGTASAAAHSAVIFKSFPVMVKNGSMRLDFTPETGEAFVSTISATRR